jgi:hypothetical protein
MIGHHKGTGNHHVKVQSNASENSLNHPAAPVPDRRDPNAPDYRSDEVRDDKPGSVER